MGQGEHTAILFVLAMGEDDRQQDIKNDGTEPYADLGADGQNCD